MKSSGADDQKKFIEGQSHLSIWKIIAFLVAGCIALALGAQWLVKGAVGIAEAMGISERLISLTVIAFGTSVPELATSIIALLKRESDISIGNLIGSNIFNILGILGVTAIFKEVIGQPPLTMYDTNLIYDIWWMIGIGLAAFIFMKSQKRIKHWEGMVLLALYIVYILWITTGH